MNKVDYKKLKVRYLCLVRLVSRDQRSGALYSLQSWK